MRLSASAPSAVRQRFTYGNDRIVSSKLDLVDRGVDEVGCWGIGAGKFQ
jgi:hypothetical protein